MTSTDDEINRAIESQANKIVEAIYDTHLEYDSSREHRFSYHVKTSHTAITNEIAEGLKAFLKTVAPK